MVGFCKPRLQDARNSHEERQKGQVAEPLTSHPSAAILEDSGNGGGGGGHSIGRVPGSKRRSRFRGESTFP